MAQTKRVQFVQSGSMLMWTFSDGKQAILDVNKVPLVLHEQATYHGFKQKAADSMAIEYKQPDGSTRKPTDSEKYAAIMQTIDNLYDGRWNAVREATGGILFRAFAILKPGRFPTVAEFTEWLAGQAEARGITVKAFTYGLETSPGKIKETCDKIRAEMAEDVDTEDVLDNL